MKKEETNNLEKTDTFEKFQAVQDKNKSHIGLILFLILIIIGLVCYICYDKGVFDSLLGKDKTVEEPKQEEELSEEEVMKLHDSLIVEDETGGIYSGKEKIMTIDNVDSTSFILFAISNYIKDNSLSISDKSDIKYDGYDGESCHYIEPLVIKEDELNNYIKEKYKTTRTFLYDKSKLSLAESDNCRTIGHFYTTGMHTNFYFDLSDNSYKIIKNQNVESVCENVNDIGIFHNKFIKSSQNNDSVFIYDKAFCFWSNFEGRPFLTNCVGKEILDKKELSEHVINGCSIDSHYIFDNYSDKLNTYKHTFKKGTDGKYYWYSSEIVNE